MNDLVKYENDKIVIADQIAEEIKQFEKVKLKMDLIQKELKQALKEAMEKHNIKKFVGNGLSAIYKDSFTRKSLDSTKLKEDLPDIYEEYLKQTEVTSSITLTIGE